MTQELVVLVTTSTRDEASAIADALVSERLCACVNIISAIESVYRWEGKIIRDNETLMIIKTIDDRYLDLERRVKELHSYTVPEIIAMRIERGSEQYLNWLRESSGDDEKPGG
jgi:periplasmic divalent cation tolerance protein